MDPDSSILSCIIAIIFLIGISGFFSLSEGAVISMNDSRLKKLAEDGDKSAKKLLKLVCEPTIFLATIQTGITICGFMIAALAAKQFRWLYYVLVDKLNFDVSTAFTINLVVVTFLLSILMIVFGKLFPKRISSYYSEAIALKIASPLYLFSIVLKPIVILTSKATDLILRLCGINSKNEPEHVTEEEIRMMVDVGEEKGVIEQSEKDMINNIFEFDDRNITDIMTHRMGVIAVEKTALISDVIKISIESGYSRVPVYEDDIDNIIGIVYVKDLLQYFDNYTEKTVEQHVREALFIPESTSCTELLKIFKIQKKQMAVIVDEYGGTYGIVTMEDLLEAIVGDIQDEYDNEESEVQKLSDGTVDFDGSISIDDVEKELGVQLISDDEDYDTLGAILIHKIGHIPKSGENATIIMSGIIFKILEVDERRILRIKAEFLNNK